MKKFKKLLALTLAVAMVMVGMTIPTFADTTSGLGATATPSNLNLSFDKESIKNGVFDTANELKFYDGEDRLVKEPHWAPEVTPVQKFIGWTWEGQTTPKTDVNLKDFHADIKLTANWEPAFTYVVTYYLLQKFDGTYSKAQGDYISDIDFPDKDTDFTPELKDIEGFTAPSAKTIKVKAGENTVEYEYKRNKYNLTVTTGEGILSAISGGAFQFDENVDLQIQKDKGYGKVVITGDAKTETFKMPAKNAAVNVEAIEYEYAIIYDLAGGMQKANPDGYYSGEDTPIVDAVKAGYDFDGWIVDGVAGKQFDYVIKKGTQGTVKMTATWVKSRNKGGGGGGSSVGGTGVKTNPGYWTLIDPVNHFWTYNNGYGLVTGWCYVPYTYEGETKSYWYHFDANGIMQWGWFTDVDGKMYYLCTDHDGFFGRMFAATTTPDGHYVDASGVRVY